MKQVSSTIARVLCRDATWDSENKECNWMGYGKYVGQKTEKSMYGSLDLDFYSGATGVVWYLLQVAKNQPEELLLSTIEGGLEFVWNQYEKNLPKEVSFFSGYGGIYAIFREANKVFDQPNLKKREAIIKEKLLTQCDVLHNGDYISGSPGLISYSNHLDENQIQEFKTWLVAQGEEMLKNSRLINSERAWKTLSETAQPLTGLAHGNAGFMVALALIYKITKDKIYLDAMLEAWNYEDSQKNQHMHNWPDYRIFNGEKPAQPNFMNAWCHGAAGIVLSRLKIVEILHEFDLDIVVSKAKNDIDFAMPNFREIFKQNLPPDKAGWSYCHGMAYNLLTAYYASIFLKDKELENQVLDYSKRSWKVIAKNPYLFRSGLHDGMYSPSFMLGLSGIGFYFLHLEKKSSLKYVI